MYLSWHALIDTVFQITCARACKLEFVAPLLGAGASTYAGHPVADRRFLARFLRKIRVRRSVHADQYAPAHLKSIWIAIFLMAIPVGYAVGYIYGAVMGTIFGWRIAFISEAFLMLPFAVFAFLTKPIPLSKAAVAGVPENGTPGNGDGLESSETDREDATSDTEELLHFDAPRSHAAGGPDGSVGPMNDDGVRHDLFWLMRCVASAHLPHIHSRAGFAVQFIPI
jgi:MFS family permease